MDSHSRGGDRDSVSAPSTASLLSTGTSGAGNNEQGIRADVEDRLIEPELEPQPQPSPESNPGEPGDEYDNDSGNDGVEQSPRSGSPSRDRQWSRSRLMVGVLLLACIVFVAVDFAGDRTIESALVAFLEWTRAHPYEGMIAVVLCYVVATICFVPGSLLSFGAGFAIGSSVDTTALGIALASACVFVGASIGSICSFLLGRYLFRDCVLQLAYSYPIFQAIERALETNGLKIMVLLRLSPLIPYNALDYISGVTSISLGDYAIAMVAMIPGIVVLCSVGASASSLSDRTATTNTTVELVTIVSGLLFGGGGVLLASYYSKIELDRILAAESTDGSAMYIAHGLSQEEGEYVATASGREHERDDEAITADDNNSGEDDDDDDDEDGCAVEPTGAPVTSATFA